MTNTFTIAHVLLLDKLDFKKSKDAHICWNKCFPPFRCFVKPLAAYLNQKYLNNIYGEANQTKLIGEYLRADNLYISKLVEHSDFKTVSCLEPF